MNVYPMTLAEAFRSPLTTAAELRTIAEGAAVRGLPDIALAARRELDRRADETSRRPLYLRVMAARESDYGRKGGR